MNKYIKSLIIIMILVFTSNVSAVTTTTSTTTTSKKTTTSSTITTNKTSTSNIELTINNYTLLIDDAANLLSDDEINKLQEDMKELTQYGNIAFVSIPKSSKMTQTTKAYARDYYHHTFGTSSGTLFLIDMYNRELYIFSDGANYRYITDSKANSIADNIYKLASNEKYYECASKAFSQINTILSGGKIAEPMRLTSNGFLAITIALLLNFMYVLITSRSSRARNDEILKGVNATFEAKDFEGHKTGTHSVYSTPSSSSGGSSGGGGFSGGGSSGGGGGHSF